MLESPLPIVTAPVLVAGVVLIGALWLAKSLATGVNSKLPPGPPRLPLIGNALQMTAKSTWLYYAELSQTYGDVVYLSAFGQSIVVLSSLEANTDVLVKKASVSSGRPYLAMLMDIIGWKSSFLLMDTVPTWKAQRKLVHQFLGPPAMHVYHPILESSAHDFVQRLVANKEFTTEVAYTVVKLIMRIGYGIKIDSPDHIVAKLSREAAKNGEYALDLGHFAVNLFPILRHVPPWFPFANFRRIGAIWREQFLAAINTPFDMVKADIANGTAEPSFSARAIEDRPTGTTDEDIKWASGTLYLGSANTTLKTMETFMTAMITHPEVQAKAQAEMDRVVGTDRLPKLADREQLPYLECIFKEVLRWHVAVPSGVPHRTTEAAEYRGWYIPKDTIILPNVWSMSQDQKVYRSPEKFIPERYEENPSLMDPRAYVFGFGRRICPGQAFGEQSTWMMMATLLSTTHMRPALDENGRELEISQEFKGPSDPNQSNFVPFPCRFEPRSPHLTMLLQESAERN